MANILIVDDQAAVRLALSEDLTDDGYDVQTAGGAREASQCLKDLPTDVVLLDLYLDGPQGWDVLQQIKGCNPHLPVIIFTAYDSYTQDPKLSLADAYVVKSVDLGELKRTIRRVLEEGRTEKEFSARHSASSTPGDAAFFMRTEGNTSR